MELATFLRGAVAAGRLSEPFTAAEAARALAHPGWSRERVQSYLSRHCSGNLAANVVEVERVAHGRYRILDRV